MIMAVEVAIRLRAGDYSVLHSDQTGSSSHTSSR